MPLSREEEELLAEGNGNGAPLGADRSLSALGRASEAARQAAAEMYAARHSRRQRGATPGECLDVCRSASDSACFVRAAFELAFSAAVATSPLCLRVRTRLVRNRRMRCCADMERNTRFKRDVDRLRLEFAKVSSELQARPLAFHSRLLILCRLRPRHASALLSSSAVLCCGKPLNPHRLLH